MAFPGPDPLGHARGPTRRSASVGVFIAALILSLLVALPSSATLPPSDFDAGDGNLLLDDLDEVPTGDADYDTDPDPDLKDWETRSAGQDGTTTGEVVSTGGITFEAPGVDITDRSSDDSFAGGTKHDSVCPNFVTGSIPPKKDDLIRFYVAHEKAGADDDVFLYLAWERFLDKDSTASAHMGFEFNQSTTACADNPKLVERTEGDMLVVYDFEGGSNPPVIRILRWLPTLDTGDACEASNSAPCWGTPAGWDADVSANGDAEAEVNRLPVHDPIAADEGYTPVDLGFPNQFGEAAINLSDAGVFSEDECTNFGRAGLGSRSSGNSFSSQLKDFIAPIPITLTNCGNIKILKVDDQATPQPVTGARFVLFHDAAEVTDDGDSSDEVYDATVDDVPVLTDVATTLDGAIGDGQDGSDGTFDVTDGSDLPTGSFVVQVDDELILISSRSGDTLTVHDDDGTTTEVDGRGYAGTTPASHLDDAAVSEVVSCETALDSNSDATCSMSNVFFGIYWLVETTTPAGYQTAAPQHVDLTPDSDDPLVFTFVDARAPSTITITKTDDDDPANPLGDVWFALYDDAALDTDDDDSTNETFDAANDAPIGTGTATTIDDTGTEGDLVDADDDGFSVASGEGAAFPDGDFMALVGSEIVWVATRSGDDFTVYDVAATTDVTEGRGRFDTTAGAHPDGESVELLYACRTANAADVLADGTLTLGECTIDNITFTGNVWVVEDEAPTGYAEADPRHLVLGADQDVDLTFVDPRLFKVIVLVCQKSDDTLYGDAEVAFDAGTLTGTDNAAVASDLTSGIDENELCQLEGSFVHDDLQLDDHDEDTPTNHVANVDINQ